MSANLLRSDRQVYKRKFVGRRGRPRKITLVFGWDFDRVGDPDDSECEETVELDMGFLEIFLTAEEWVILNLFLDGKEASDIATILKLRTRQWAWLKLQKLKTTIKYYLENRDHLMRILSGEIDYLSRREIVFLQDRLINRLTYAKIGKRFDIGSDQVYRVLKVVREKAIYREDGGLLGLFDGFPMVGPRKGGYFES